MTPIAKGLGVLFGLPIVLGIVFFTYFNVTGADRMKAVCSQVTPGTTQAQLKKFALEQGLGGSPVDTGVAFLSDPRSYGRHTCKVTMAAGVVTVAEYNFAD